MKTLSSNFILSFLFLAIVFSACKKPEENKPDYPIKISFEEYSLYGTHCQWTNMPNDNKVIVINSHEELKPYILCNAGSYPAIDFEKHSLLLASGKSYNKVLDAQITGFQQYVSDKYRLDVAVTLSDTAFQTSWAKACITQKMPADRKIRVNLATYENEVVYPIDIPYTEYSLEGTQCYWHPYPSGYSNKMYFFVQIRNNEELEKHIQCREGTFPEIDFSKYTLLLVRGETTERYIHVTLASLQLTAEQNIEIRIFVSFVSVSPIKNRWSLPILVDKNLDNYPVHTFVNF